MSGERDGRFGGSSGGGGDSCLAIRLWRWKPKHKDGPFGWLVASASFLSLFFSLGLSQGTIGVMTQAIGQRFVGVSRSDLAWIGATRMGFMFCTGLVWSLLVDRVGSRPVQLAGGALLTLAVGLSVLAREIWHLYLTYGALTGVALSLIFTAASVAVDGHFERLLHVALPLSQLGGTVGYCVFPVATQRLLEAVGFDASLHAFCGLALVPCLLALAYTGGVRPTQQPPRPEAADAASGLELESPTSSPTTTEASSASAAASSGGGDGDRRSLWQRLRALLTTGGTWLEMLNFFGTQYTSSTIFVLLPIVVADAGVGGGGLASNEAAAHAATVFGAANVAGHVITTLAALRPYNRLLLFAIACVLFGASVMSLVVIASATAAAIAANSEAVLYALCAFGGLWFGAVLGLLMSVIHHFSAPARLTDMFGLSTLVAGLGGLAGPSATGLIQARVGNAAGLYVSGAFSIVAGIAILPAAYQKQRELARASAAATAAKSAAQSKAPL